MINRVSNQSPQDLLVIAYAFDPNSMVFSHQYGIICKLSETFRNVFVIANEINQVVKTPSNIKTLNLNWKPHKPLRNALHLYRIFFSVYFKCPNFILFSFMTETHSMILGPLTKLLQIRHVLWYAHVSYPLRLRIAKKFVDRILTSTSESIPPKWESEQNLFLTIGQMVDNNMFLFNEERTYERRENWMYVGRLDPSKEVETLITLFKRHLLSFPMATFTIVGKSTQGNEHYEVVLKNKCLKEISSGKIIFKGQHSQKQIADLLSKSDLFIHCFHGSLDKSLVEATMSGITVITINDAYIRQFGTLGVKKNLDDNNIDFLQKEVDYWRQAEASKLKSISLKRSEQARVSHSANQWIEKLVEALVQ